MQIIDTEAALDGVADPNLRPILDRYAGMMDLGTIYIAEPGDTLETLAVARGWPCSGWEFVHDHGGWLEAVFVIADFGDGHIVLVPEHADTNPELLARFKASAIQPGG